jgi:MFS family permease
VEQLDFYCAPDYLIGLLGACFLMGIVIGCSTLTRLGDKHGRKPVYLLGVVIHICFTLSMLISTNQIVDFCLIFMFGMSVTARYYVGYTYNLEM